MKEKQNAALKAFTLLELFLVLAVLVVLASMLLPAVSTTKCKAPRIQCINNLKQIGLAYRIWSSENNDTVPSTASFERGGLGDSFVNPSQGINCWRSYGVLATNLAMLPKILICPADERQPATNFIVKWSSQDKGGADWKDNTHLSYFVGVGSCATYPQSMLGGDRNLAPGLVSSNDYGFSLGNNRGNDIVLNTNTPVCWSLKMHSAGNVAGAGNILLGDGSAQQVSSGRFRSDWQPNAGIPIARYSDLAPSAPSFRLIFP